MKTIISLLLVIAIVSCKKANTSPTNNSNNNNNTTTTTNNSNSNINDTCWVNYEKIIANSVEIDKNDMKWFAAFGLFSNGLYSFDNKWNYYATTNLYSDKLKINPITLEKTTYLSSSPGGLNTFNGNGFSHKDSLNNMKLSVISAEYDDQGNLWFINISYFKTELINANNSVNKIDLSPFITLSNAKSIKYHKNTLWIGSALNGVVKFDITQNKVTETFNQSNSMIGSNDIVDIVFDNLDNLWVATNNGGISKYNGKTWENFNSVNSGLIHNMTTSIAVDKYNNIWVGTLMGLSKYNNSNWINYTTSNSKILDNEILDVAVDKQDNKWIVTKEGVSKLSKTKTN